MINAGDKFSVIDLQQAVHEVCDYDILKYVDKKLSSALVVIGDSIVSPIDYTPDRYADMRIRQFADIPSSAANLDRQLRDRGYKTTYRFSYNYKKGGLTSSQIVRDAYCLEWYMQIYNTAVLNSGCHKEYFTAMDNAFRVSYYYAQYLWAVNSQVCGDIARKLRMPDTSNWSQIISAILGIGFKFHHKDILEFIAPCQQDKRYTEQLAFKKDMIDNYGIDTGCLVLSPENREKLQKIVTRTDTPYYLQVIKNLNPFRHR